MNFVRCRVADGGALLSAASFSLPSPPAARAALAARIGQTVIAGVRPENIIEVSRPAREPTVRLELSTELVDPLGNEIVFHGRCGDDVLVCRMDPHLQPAMGTAVQTTIEVDALHLFDAESEELISTDGGRRRSAPPGPRLRLGQIGPFVAAPALATLRACR